MKNIEVLRLKGGLGNQLFQYAYALKNTKNDDKTFLIDAFSGFRRDRVFRRSYELDAFLGRRLSLIDKVLAPIVFYMVEINFRIRRKFNKYDLRFEENKSIKIPLINFNVWDGYFQNDLIESGVISQIADMFYKKNIDRICELNLKNNLFVLHLRIYECVEKEIGCYLDSLVEYYDENRSLRGGVLTIVTNGSLGIEAAERLVNDLILLGICPSRSCFSIESSNTAIEDFIKLVFANHLVISESTYSWWAAQIRRCILSKFTLPTETITSVKVIVSDRSKLPSLNED